VAIGASSGNIYQGTNAVAVGNGAGQTNQGQNAVAIGNHAGQNTQGGNSVAIGFNAGQTSQPANSIVINATGSVLNGATSSACYVAPIRGNLFSTSSQTLLGYDTVQKEVIYCNSTYFRYVPWTVGYTMTGSAYGGAINCTSVLTHPVAGGNISTYLYSIVGNTMYLNINYSAVNITGATAGTSFYWFNIPAGYTIDTTLQIAHSSAGTLNADGPTLVGECYVAVMGTSDTVGQVFIRTTSTTQLGCFLTRGLASYQGYWSQTLFPLNVLNMIWRITASFAIN
jgi:hypothetical protein